MTIESLARPQEEAAGDYEQVCWRLAGFDARVSPEWVDGYLSGVLAGPRAVPPEEWLPRMLGEAFGRVFADPPDERYARRALVSRWREIGAQLDAEGLLDDPDAIRLGPWLLEFEDADRADFVARGLGSADDAQRELRPGVAWSRGFRAAIADGHADWVQPDAGSDDARRFASALASIDALQLGDDELAAHLRSCGAPADASRDDLIDAACLAAQDLRLYWVDHAPRPETRHVDKQPGRNDPCPCGSGRKFKKCHGA
ncbi:MAG: UPF0149 family protein [Burkholderiaceae bacterium]